MKQRIGVVISGPPASGKTVLWKLLAGTKSFGSKDVVIAHMVMLVVEFLGGNIRG